MTDHPPKIEQKQPQVDPALVDKLAATSVEPSRKPISPAQAAPAPPPPPPESESDDPALEIATGAKCRRRACGAQYSGGSREGEKCVYHPGAPIFHEGSKGYSCCKRRVLEFDQFMKIEGCKTKDRHLFVGSGKKKGGPDGSVVEGGEELLQTVRYVVRLANDANHRPPGHRVVIMALVASPNKSSTIPLKSSLRQRCKRSTTGPWNSPANKTARSQDRLLPNTVDGDHVLLPQEDCQGQGQGGISCTDSVARPGHFRHADAEAVSCRCASFRGDRSCQIDIQGIGHQARSDLGKGRRGVMAGAAE